MSIQLTQKERLYLQDLMSHEQSCIIKYGNYAQRAQDPALKQLFSQYQTQEQNHYNTLNQLLQGQQPNMGGGQGSSQNQQNSQVQGSAGLAIQDDAELCKDLLMTEKYISSTYNTAVFEALNQPVRQALQHIQKEEQQHGEGIFNYMYQHGMYQVQK